MKRISIVVLAGSLALLTVSAAHADSSGGGTQDFGPFPSSSPDGGTCGAPWANDTFDRSFRVHDNGDGTLFRAYPVSYALNKQLAGFDRTHTFQLYHVYQLLLQISYFLWRARQDSNLRPAD